MTICSEVFICYRNVMDGQTDGQTDRRTDRQKDRIAICADAC